VGRFDVSVPLASHSLEILQLQFDGSSREFYFGVQHVVILHNALHIIITKGFVPGIIVLVMYTDD